MYKFQSTFTYRPIQGEVLPIASNKVYFMEHGLGYLWEVHANGLQTLIGIITEGIAFEVPTNLIHLYELRASQPCSIVEQSWDEIKESETDVIKKLRKFYLQQQELAAIIRYKYVEDRLLNVLKFLSNGFSDVVANDRVRLTLPFTHEEIASIILSTRSTVTRLLNSLEKNNIISFVKINGKRYIRLEQSFWDHLVA